jgi:hypothetical protein
LMRASEQERFKRGKLPQVRRARLAKVRALGVRVEIRPISAAILGLLSSATEYLSTAVGSTPSKNGGFFETTSAQTRSAKM